jgi:6-phosphogluconolactonase
MTVPARTVTVLPDAAGVARAGADEVARRLRDAVSATGTFFLALAGGHTPRALHAELVARHAALPWDAVRVFFGDERRVGPDHPDSNFRMARETLLDKLPFRADAVHMMPGDDADAERAAREYESVLREQLSARGRSGLDLVLLGLGPDGHTASLFPGSPALDERTRWVVPAESPPGPPVRTRLTLTFPALAAAQDVLFLVTGAAKRDALRAALHGEAPPPAGRVVARRTVGWLVDEAAAS